MDCVFCKIANGEIPAKVMYEDESVIAFYDLEPVAPKHILIIPKQHIVSADEINEQNSHIVSHIFEVAAKLAAQNNLSDGYRIINNCGDDGGQTVKHLHFHLIGGRKLSWPPG